MSLLVEWESVRGAEYYILSYYPKADEGAIKEVQVENTKNSYLITGLRSGVTYIVQVYAVIRGINSEADQIEATTGKNCTFLYTALQKYNKIDVTCPMNCTQNSDLPNAHARLPMCSPL